MPATKAAETVATPRAIFTSPSGLQIPLPPPPVSGLPIIGESTRLAHCECKGCQAHASSRETHLRLKFSEYREILPTKVERLSDHQYSILPSHMFAFVLNDRTYGLFY